MAQTGRKPLPTNIHKLQGNRSKLPKESLETSFLPETEIPPCPMHLGAAAKKEWKRITPKLKDLGVISQIDMAALAAYCNAYGRWVDSEKILKSMGSSGLIHETDTGYQQMSVYLQISNRAVEQMFKFLTEFGMSPSSRTRIKPSKSAGEKIDKNGPDRFF